MTALKLAAISLTLAAGLRAAPAQAASCGRYPACNGACEAGLECRKTTGPADCVCTAKPAPTALTPKSAPDKADSKSKAKATSDAIPPDVVPAN